MEDVFLNGGSCCVNRPSGGGLREYLSQVPDSRERKGRRHVFAATLTAVVCEILQNCRDYDAIGQWLSKQPIDFLHALGFWRTPPTASGLRKLLSKIDATVLEDALTRWITVVLPEATPASGLTLIALDGKSLRGTWNRLDRAVHLLNGRRSTDQDGSFTSASFPVIPTNTRWRWRCPKTGCITGFPYCGGLRGGEVSGAAATVGAVEDVLGEGFAVTEEAGDGLQDGFAFSCDQAVPELLRPLHAVVNLLDEGLD